MAVFQYNGVFNDAFVFTYDGLKEILNDYQKTHSIIDFNILKNLNLTRGEKRMMPLNNYNLWYNYILQFSKNIVNTLYVTEDEIIKDKNISKWFKTVVNNKFKISRINMSLLIAYIYFNQIRHNGVSNEIFTYFVFLENTYLTKYKTGSQYNLFQQMQRIIINLTTSLSWLMLTTNMSTLLKNAKYKHNKQRIINAQKIWNEFYVNLWNLKIDQRVPLMRVTEMEASTGF